MIMFRTALLVCLSVFLLFSCSPREELMPDHDDYEPSGIDAGLFFERYQAANPMPESLSGRASVQVREPEGTERLTIHFKSNRTHSLMKLRNQLGMEGGQLYSDPDSVIVYNRLEESAHKMSHQDAAWFYLNGVAAMNLLQILQPIDNPESIVRIYENENVYLVQLNDGQELLFDRESMRMKQSKQEVDNPKAYNNFAFDSYAEVDGYHFPARLRILSSDQKSNIFLVIRSMNINPSELDFDPDIPDDIDIIRL